MAVSISLTGISPLHGSHAALPIACDAFNARTVAVGSIIMYFVLSWLARCYVCFAVEYFSLGFRVKRCHGVFSAQLRHKRKVSGLPYDTPPLSCGYICQRTGSRLPYLRKGKRRRLFLNLEHKDSLHEL